MTPVEVLMDNDDEKVPVLLPVITGDTAVIFEQTEGYVTVAVGVAVTV